MSIPRPSQYRERTLAIVHFIGRYGVAIPAAISQAFFGSVTKQSGSVLKAESHQGGLLTAHLRWLPGGLSAYTLSARGCQLANLPVERSQPPGPAALDLALAVLYFAVLAGPARRYRLEHAELGRIFGQDVPPRNLPHVLTDEAGPPQLLRLYQANQDAASTVKRLREISEQLRSRPVVQGWVAQRDYGVGVLVPTSEQIEPYRRAIARSGLEAELAVQVGLGPTAATLASELRRRKKL